jgi:hypothetical protein
MLLAESLLGTNAASAPVYIEDVFSTYLYTATGSSQTITNGIDLSTKGGLVWIKERNAAGSHILVDTVRGASNYLQTSSTAAQANSSEFIPAFYSNGFATGPWFASTNTYASWTFRKQAKFFDVVTVTADGSGNLIANHNLGSVPGSIFIKRTDGISDWDVWHRSLTATQVLKLNTTAAAGTRVSGWMNATSSSFTTSSGYYTAGGTYVAYLFAHDAGGFGAGGADNVISCGSFTTDGSGNATVNLGYEPQWVILKNATTASNNEWRMVDNMRGFPVDGASSSVLAANSSAAEFTSGTINVLNTGIQIDGLANSATFIYIAIRRGPMKTPTTGTSVFSPIASSAATGTKLTTNFPVDLQMFALRTSGQVQAYDRLRGVSSTTTESGQRLITSSTAAESTVTATVRAWDNTGFQMASFWTGSSMVFWNFGRAPGFFDVVCYTGTGAASIVLNHNLTVIPGIYIIKARSAVGDWQTLFNVSGTQYRFWSGASPASGLNLTTASTNTSNLGGLTSTTFTPTFYMGNTHTNSAGVNYVAYLFASVAGVSKVGSYTGTGTTNQINCGFTGGARFVMIKRTDSTGDWYVWDSVRGIVAGNDPYLLLNSTAAEVTGTDYVDTYSAGFEISSTAPAAINANGGSFIFWAIA